MLSPKEIRAWALRQYPRFLSSVVTGESFFPKEVPFGRIKPSDDFGKVMQSVQALDQSRLGFAIEWETRTFRQWKEQQIPKRVWFPDEASFVQTTETAKEVESFRRCVSQSRDSCPELLSWMAQYPRQVLEEAASWADLLKVVLYLRKHPRPGCYLRELPVAVGTKFVERHDSTIESLLRELLPAEYFSSANRFEERLGFRYDQPLIRFRVLDPSPGQIGPSGVSDFSVPMWEARILAFQGLSVVVTENKMNFLTLPPLPGALAIWGQGNAAQLLTDLPWLDSCRIFYWGDLDVHGFHILSRLRERFPRIESVLMDEKTLEDFPGLVREGRSAAYELTGALTSSEFATYRRVQAHGCLLEQEQLPQEYSSAKLRAAVIAGSFPCAITQM